MNLNKMTDKKQERGVADHRPEKNPEYGMFQGVANYPPQVGLPQPVRPPGLTEPGSEHHHHLQGYPTVPGYSVNDADGIRPQREPRRLRCCGSCGMGMGWILFILGFFLGAIPWYIGAFLLICTRSIEQRDKSGYIACIIAASIATIVAIILGATASLW